jgi:hypothetical protein
MYNSSILYARLKFAILQPHTIHLNVKPHFSSVQGTALVVILNRFVVCFLNNMAKSTVFVIQCDDSECKLIRHFTCNVIQDYAVSNSIISTWRSIDLPKKT